MGSGLLWAGLGEGISKAGASIGAYMSKGIEDEEKDKRDEQRQAAAERRQQALLDKKEELEEGKAKKQSEIRRDAEKTAGEGLINQKFEIYKAKVRDDERNYPGMEPMTDEQLLQAFKEQRVGKDPEYTPTEVERRKAVLEEISKDSRGANYKTIDQASDALTAAEKAEALARSEARKEREQLAREKKYEADSKISQQRADAATTLAAAAVTRAERAGREKPEKPPTDAGLNASIKSATSAITEAIGVKETDGTMFQAKLKSLRKKADSGDESSKEAIAEYDAQVAIRKKARDALNEKNKVGDSGKTEKPAESKAAKPVSDGIPRPKSAAERDSLKPGTQYYDPNGILRRR